MNLSDLKLYRRGDYLFVVHRDDAQTPNRSIIDDIVDELNDLNDRIERLESQIYDS